MHLRPGRHSLLRPAGRHHRLIRSRLVSNQAASNRFRPPFVPILVFIVLLAVAIPSTIIWSGYKHLDGTSAASAQTPVSK